METHAAALMESCVRDLSVSVNARTMSCLTRTEIATLAVSTKSSPTDSASAQPDTLAILVVSACSHAETTNSPSRAPVPLVP